MALACVCGGGLRRPRIPHDRTLRPVEGHEVQDADAKGSNGAGACTLIGCLVLLVRNVIAVRLPLNVAVSCVQGDMKACTLGNFPVIEKKKSLSWSKLAPALYVFKVLLV